jgi:hypothetical protein
MNIDSFHIEIDKRKSIIERKIDSLENKIKIFTYITWIFVGLGFIVVGYGIYKYLYPISDELTLNELGDYFAGSVASVWSLAGLFFIYVAFLGQKQQLLNQQIELLFSQAEVRATRIELKGQKEQLIEQNNTLKLQKFENTFFQLLKNHNDIVNSIDLRIQRSGRITAQGRDCFKSFYERIKGKIKKNDLRDSINAYMDYYKEQQSDLGHYYRNMYQILKFIKESDFIDNAKRYSNILRAQLSSFELVLLFYNCLGPYGKVKFKPLIEEFAFLKNINVDLLFDKSHIIAYEKSAFGNK